MMPILGILQLVVTVAPLLAAGIRLTLHLIGSDKHKTVAGELAGHLDQAAATAKELLDGVHHGDPFQDPPT